MTPNQRKTQLLKVYWGLQRLQAKCSELELTDIAQSLWHHAEKVGVMAAVINVRKMNTRGTQGKKEDGRTT